MDLGLDGRVYVVTGGSAGLGFATAQALVGDGARVVVASRSSERVSAAVERLGGPPVAVGLAADVADPSTAQRLVDLAQTSFGRLDGALLSTGGPPQGTVMETTDEAWRQGFEAVFLGVVRTARTVVETLTPGGAVLFVLSTSVRAPIIALAVSNGLRPGLAMVAKTLADEVGPRGVRVNALLPGRIATGRIQELDEHRTPDEIARMRAAIPLGRYGEPDEVGRVAAFLLSPAASYITGSALTVDGGSVRSI
jgi:3-oxoacyl-[acyl-carrier protein] reductase